MTLEGSSNETFDIASAIESMNQKTAEELHQFITQRNAKLREEEWRRVKESRIARLVQVIQDARMAMINAVQNYELKFYQDIRFVTEDADVIRETLTDIFKAVSGIRKFVTISIENPGQDEKVDVVDVTTFPADGFDYTCLIPNQINYLTFAYEVQPQHAVETIANTIQNLTV